MLVRNSLVYKPGLTCARLKRGASTLAAVFVQGCSSFFKIAAVLTPVVLAAGTPAGAADDSYSAPPVFITSIHPSQAGELIQLEFAEEGGEAYQLQSSGALNTNDSGWEFVATFTNSPVDVPRDPGETRRFYRIILDPLASFLSTNTPETVGGIVVENLLARPGYDTNSDGTIHYAELCAADGAFNFVNLTANAPLYAELENRYACFMESDCSMIDSSASGQFQVSLVVLAMYNYNHDPAYWQRVLDLAAGQWGKWAGGPPGYLRFWNDDMYFSGTVNPRIFRLTGYTNSTYIATTQLSMYLDALQLPNGLLKHTKDVPFVWSRGAGWGAAGLAETLMTLPHDHPKRAALMNGYLKLMEGLLPYQTDSGLWLQVIDYTAAPANYEETSGTAMFTYAMATGLRYGWLDSDIYGPVVRKAWLGLVGKVDENGNVRDVCIGTNEKQTADEYLARPSEAGDFHGQAPLLWTANALILYRRSIGLPAISFTDPTPTALQAGYSDVRVTVDAFGQEETIQRVDLYFAGTYIGEKTEMPYVWHSGDYPALLGKTPGSYNLIAIATGTNLFSTAITNTVTVTEQPTIFTFTAPTPSEVVAGYSTLDVAVDAQGPAGTFERIELYFDGTFIGEATGVPYQWSSDMYPALLGKPVGSYELVAVATDINTDTMAITNVLSVVEPGVEISISFDCETGTNRLAGIENITLAYSIDGSGNISLNAGTTDSGAPAEAVTEINTWDGSVGTTTNSSLFNTSFTLTGTAKGTTTNGVERVKDIRMDSSRSTRPVLGVTGENSSRIDGWSALGGPELESILWTLSSTNIGLEFTAFDADNTGSSAALRVSDSDSTVLLLNLTNGETRSLDDQGMLITNGEAVIFSAEANVTNGAGLAGLTFNVFINP